MGGHYLIMYQGDWPDRVWSGLRTTRPIYGNWLATKGLDDTLGLLTSRSVLRVRRSDAWLGLNTTRSIFDPSIQKHTEAPTTIPTKFADIKKKTKKNCRAKQKMESRTALDHQDHFLDWEPAIVQLFMDAKGYWPPTNRDMKHWHWARG